MPIKIAKMNFNFFGSSEPKYNFHDDKTLHDQTPKTEKWYQSLGDLPAGMHDAIGFVFEGKAVRQILPSLTYSSIDHSLAT